MPHDGVDNIDRLSIRQRPEGTPLMEHHWGKLLFMHWKISPEALRPHIPGRLSIDTHGGEAWIGITPFTLWDVRLTFTPAVPWLSDFHELNVRTYVHLDGVPGVWFLSLNANSLTTVLGARTLFHLPYFQSSIDLVQRGETINYDLRRTGERAGDFHAQWTIGEPLGEAEPGTLEFFLVERYCLYSTDGSRLYRARIHHRPWPLQRATLDSYSSNMIEEDGIRPPSGDPLVHYAEALAVNVWPLEEV